MHAGPPALTVQGIGPSRSHNDRDAKCAKDPSYITGKGGAEQQISPGVHRTPVEMTIEVEVAGKAAVESATSSTAATARPGGPATAGKRPKKEGERVAGKAPRAVTHRV